MFKYSEDSFVDKRGQGYKYLKYMINHKLGVLEAGSKLNVPTGAMLKHDWSKFKPGIWEGHRDYFYGIDGITGTKNHDVFKAYKQARSDHFELEPGHHNLAKTLEQELESVADWYAVYKAQELSKGKSPMTFKAWWWLNKPRVKHQMSDLAIAEVDRVIPG